jgi:succinoglycan biosynthesis protein ExoL
VHPEKENGRNVILFQPDLSETTTIARAQELVDGGFHPTVFGFRRARYNRDYVAPWPQVELGRTQDAQYWRRLRALIGALPTLARNRTLLGSGVLFLARNLDQLLLALLARALFNRRAILVYEVVDIQPALTQPGMPCAAMRLIERLCLARIELVAVSSPAFVLHYFAARQRYRGEWIVVENKLRLCPTYVSRAMRLRERRRKSSPAGRRWIVGYFGLIRGRATIELIVRLARHFPDRLEFRFRGVLTTVDRAWFRAAIAQAGNITYEGEFANPGDLAELYGGVDLAWALDLENVEANSRWLLPCRFYEAGLFGVPCLAVREFEIGRLIERLDAGWTFEHPLEDSLRGFFASLDGVSYECKRRKLLALPTTTFVARRDGDGLCEKLRRLVRSRAAPRSRSPVHQEFTDEDRVAAGRLETD